MTILHAAEKFDHFNLARSVRKNAICEFRNILGKEKERVISLLKSKVDSFFSHGAALMSNANDYLLNHGLEEIIKGADVGDEYPPAQFFCHFFTWTYQRSDAVNREGLIQKLIGHLSSMQGLSPFFAELEIAFSYLHQGNDVHLIDLIGKNESSYDLIVVRNGIEINVEVKSVRYDVYLPAPQGSINRALSVVCDWANRNIVGNLFYEIELVFRDIARPTYAQVLRAAEDLTKVAEAKSGQWGNRIFRLKVREISESELKGATVEALIRGLAENIHKFPFFLAVPTRGSNDRFFIGLNFEKMPSNGVSIGKAMERACKQLPRNKLRIVHLCLVGAGFLRPENLSQFTRGFCSQDKMVLEQFRKSYAKELVGACISCDSFYVVSDGQDGILSSIPYSQLICNPRSASVALYINNFTPEQRGKMVESVHFKKHPYAPI